MGLSSDPQNYAKPIKRQTRVRKASPSSHRTVLNDKRSSGASARNIREADTRTGRDWHPAASRSSYLQSPAAAGSPRPVPSHLLRPLRGQRRRSGSPSAPVRVPRNARWRDLREDSSGAAERVLQSQRQSNAAVQNHAAGTRIQRGWNTACAVPLSSAAPTRPPRAIGASRPAGPSRTPAAPPRGLGGARPAPAAERPLPGAAGRQLSALGRAKPRSPRGGGSESRRRPFCRELPGAAPSSAEPGG